MAHTFLKLIVATIVILGLGKGRVLADIPRTVELGGAKLDLLSHDYYSKLDQTVFKYRLTPSITGLLANSLKLKLPDQKTGAALQRIVSDLPATRLFDGGGKVDTIEFSNLRSKFGPSEFELWFGGNMGEGVAKLEGLNLGNLLSSPLKIVGPMALESILTNPELLLQDANPLCNIDQLDNLEAVVGQPFHLDVKITDPADRPLTVNYQQWPSEATLSVPSGDTVSSGSLLGLDWIPNVLDAGNLKTLPLSISSGDLIHTICDVTVNVTNNVPPVIRGISGLLNAECQGAITKISLDASQSYDPEGKPLAYSWSHNCSDATLADSENSRAILSLTLPGQGTAQNCQVTVQASDGTNASSATIVLSSAACDVNCDPSEKDLCGVCAGSNACIDCKGALFGDSFLDQCGVCGGTNACINCRGEINGPDLNDSCGVCGGNNSSCRNCTLKDLQSVLMKLDGTAREEAKVIAQKLKNIKKPNNKKRAKGLSANAHQIYTRSWELVWSLNPTTKSCAHYVGCANSSSRGVLDEYIANSKDLRKIALHGASLLKKERTRKARKFANKLRKLANSQLFLPSVTVSSYPEITYQCD